jgi:hypothetical protein
MAANMSKPGCAQRGCGADHTLMSKYCMAHIHSNDETEATNVTDEAPSALDAIINGPFSKKKAPKANAKKAKAKAPKKAKAKAVKPKAKKAKAKKAPSKKAKAKVKKTGTTAQYRAAKEAKKHPKVDWFKEVERFNKKKAKTMSIELGSPGSAQVTRVRLIGYGLGKGLDISTTGAVIKFKKVGK